MASNDENNGLKKLVYSFFSDALMIFLALLVIPVLALQFFYPLTGFQRLIVAVVDWVIWTAFLLEFALKAYVEKSFFAYVKKNKLDSLISIIVILSPALELFSKVFSGAVALRILRLSRLVRVAGVAGKAHGKWRSINIKSYLIVAVLIALGFIVAVFKPTISYAANDIVWLTAFISIIGVIFAVVSAFTIVHVWSEFNSLDNEIKREAVLLRNASLLADQLSSNSFDEKLRKAILAYARSNVDTFWRKTSTVEASTKRFVEIIKTVDELKPQSQKDLTLFNNIVQELRTASATRINILSLVKAKTPNIVWFLITYLSALLISGISIMDFQNRILAMFIIVTTSAAIALVSLLIYDMDFPFQSGFWIISPEAYFELEEFLENKGKGGTGSK